MVQENYWQFQISLETVWRQQKKTAKIRQALSFMPNAVVEVNASSCLPALTEPDTQLRLFGKPELTGRRRMGVALAKGETVEQARATARSVAAAVKVEI